jgi:hypothetical protein
MHVTRCVIRLQQSGKVRRKTLHAQRYIWVSVPTTVRRLSGVGSHRTAGVMLLVGVYGCET